MVFKLKNALKYVGYFPSFQLKSRKYKTQENDQNILKKKKTSVLSDTRWIKYCRMEGQL